MPTAVPSNIEKVKKIPRGMGELILHDLLKLGMQGGVGIALNNIYTSFYHLYLGLFAVFFFRHTTFLHKLSNSFPAGACGVKTKNISVSFVEVFVTVMTLNQNTNVFVVSVFEDTKM